jgi:glycosyltransferase involved in cell wall biosynthesis
MISVCIPAYNRAALLPPLLDSIVGQSFTDYEIVIAEDKSPERDEIRAVAERYSRSWPDRIRYHENPANFGYDANLRNLIELSTGKYCLFMGNDDLMCPEALTKVAAAVKKHQNVGVVLRSYAAFDGTPDNVVQTYRYFDEELFFPAGAQSIATVYRRSVVIPGMVIHREAALRRATERFDGTLLYQLYLVADILVDMNAVYLPDITVLYRNGGVPDFGNSMAEKGKFSPKQQTPESSLHFIDGMLAIAKYVESSRSVDIYRHVLRDVGNYSYPILAIQARQPLKVFLRYAISLAQLGLGRQPMFYAYLAAILLVGTRRLDACIAWIKRRLGRTPMLGKLYRGESG